MRERIRQLVPATPFVPLIIHIASGKTYRVPHPDYVMAGSDYPHVVVEEPSCHIHIINSMLITSVEKEPSSTAA